MRLPAAQDIPIPEPEPEDDDPDPATRPVPPLYPYGPARLRPGRWLEVGRRPARMKFGWRGPGGAAQQKHYQD